MTVGRSIYDKLKQAAKGKDFETVKRRWAFERFVARIAVRAAEDGWVLKGGVLMQSLQEAKSRATLDIDFSIRRDGPAGPGDVLAALSLACASDPADPDAMEFTLDLEASRIIREFAEQPTVRAYVDGTLRCGGEGYKDMPVRFMVDATRAEFEHPVSVCVFPALLKGFQPTPIPAYPWEMVAAEKLHAIITGTLRNPRLRDYMDIICLARSGVVDRDALAPVLAEVFAARDAQVDIAAIGLSDEFSRSRQADWRGTLGRTGYAGLLPVSFTEAMDELRCWADPVMLANLANGPSGPR